MDTSPLPDLFPHRVPDDATLPDDTRYTVEAGTSAAMVLIAPAGPRFARVRWTETPIATPRPVPPTEPGTVLLDVTTTEGCSWDRAYYTPSDDDDSMPWHLIVFHGTGTGWARTEELVSWTVADVAPRTVAAPDPLDETDHRDHILENRGAGKHHSLIREAEGQWRVYWSGKVNPAGNVRSLREWSDLGWTVGFADKEKA